MYDNDGNKDLFSFLGYNIKTVTMGKDGNKQTLHASFPGVPDLLVFWGDDAKKWAKENNLTIEGERQ